MNAGPHLPPFMPELHRIYETAARHLEAVSRLLAARADEEPRDLGEDFLPAIATEIGAAWTVH